jgi:hypothetical protein
MNRLSAGMAGSERNCSQLKLYWFHHLSESGPDQRGGPSHGGAKETKGQRTHYPRRRRHDDDG